MCRPAVAGPYGALLGFLTVQPRRRRDADSDGRAAPSGDVR